MPQRPVLARDQRDGRGAHRRRADGFRGREPRPQRAARQAQAVEPVRIVFIEARGEHVALPGRGRNFVALELRDDGGEAFDALGFRLRA